MKRFADGSEKDVRIRLNVGGRRLETRKNVLCSVKDSMLERMFNGLIPAEPDEDGYYFFDRDGKIFEEYILRYLRCFCDGEDIHFGRCDEWFFIQREFDYFQIPYSTGSSDKIDPVRLSAHHTLKLGFDPVTRAVVGEKILVVQSKKAQTHLSTLILFDLETFEQKYSAFEGKLSISGASIMDNKLLYICCHQLKSLDLVNFEDKTLTDGKNEAFILAKNFIITFPDKYEPLVVRDSSGKELEKTSYAVRDTQNMLFDGENLLYSIFSREIIVYRLNFDGADPSMVDLTKSPFIQLQHSVKFSIPIISSAMCGSILCTTTSKKIQMWDSTNFKEGVGKKISFGLGKITKIATMGPYIIAATGVNGSKLKIYTTDSGIPIDEIEIDNDGSPTCFESNGKYFFIGRMHGYLEVWKC
jgi:hypothetical protein